MKKVISTLFILFEILLNAESPQSLDGFEQIKFFFKQKDYDMVLDLVNYTDVDSTKQDSVLFIKAISLGEQEKWTEATDAFIDLIRISSDDSLKNICLTKLKKTIKKLSVTDSIEKITKLLKITDSPLRRTKILLWLSDIYDKNHLFSEAKDIYTEILQDTVYQDSTKIMLKIAITDIFLKEFEEAKDILEDVMVFGVESYGEEALFFYYIVNEGLGDHQYAREILIYLYRNFPHHKNRLGIIKALANNYLNEKQYIMSWYFLNILYKSSSEFEKITIYEKISELKKIIGSDSLGVDQFEYLKPNWEDK